VDGSVYAEVNGTWRSGWKGVCRGERDMEKRMEGVCRGEHSPISERDMEKWMEGCMQRSTGHGGVDGSVYSEVNGTWKSGWKIICRDEL
jgi:hypothetical protein